MENKFESDEKKNTPTVTFALRRLPWKQILIGTGIAAVIFLILFLSMISHLIATAPDIDSITVSPTESATYICDQDGNYLRKLTLASSNRDIVALDEIPDALQKAIVAIEDERFYEHGGIDLRGILRAFVSGIFSGSFSEGASTITQQLIKNNVFTEWTHENSFRERFSRKIQEQYLALQLENRISKEEILEDYLNTINLGAGCYGVQSAARRYFGKDVSELTVSESAVLAAIPQNPSRYNPITNPDANRARRNVVLNYMTAQGYLTEEEKNNALADDVYDRIHEFDAAYEDESIYSYYEDALIDQAIDMLIEKKGYTSDQAYRAVYSGGLRIFSAQDIPLQKICDEEFQNPDNFPDGTEFGVDYALSVADEYGQVTHYSSEALRSYIRENIDSAFDLLCTSAEEAQGYADSFRESILQADSGNPEYALQTDSENSEYVPQADPDNTKYESQDTNKLTVLAERLSLSPQPQASLVLMDQQTGFVRALVGGRGEKTASLTLNRATETTRQPGSTFKILTAYAPALDAFDQTLATLYENEQYRYEDGTPVSNWDITDYSGIVTIREAIMRSINVIAVKCITEISPRVGFEYAKRFGITTLHESYESESGRSSDIIQPLALGGITQGVTNLELCSAYASIANGGVYRTPKFFTKILDRQGKVLLDFTEDQNPKKYETEAENEAREVAAVNPGTNGNPEDSTRVLSDSTAFLLTDAMKDVVNAPSGTAFGTISAGMQPVAGKTGTTSNYKDIWFVGYTPFYTCCVWGGYDNNQSLPDGSTYHSYNKILWSAVMNRVHEGIGTSDFDIPESVVPVTLCRDSHLPAIHGGCMETYVEYFAIGTEPEKKCNLHKAPVRKKNTAIYSDILNLLPGFSEPESESWSEVGSEFESEEESGADTEFGAGVESEVESRPESETKPAQDESGTPPGQNLESPNETGTTPGQSKTLPENFRASEQSNSGQPDTNSLEDLMNRLTGSNHSGQGIFLP